MIRILYAPTMGIEWHLSVVLIGISLITKIEHLFICLCNFVLRQLCIFVFPLLWSASYIFLAQFSIGLSVFFLFICRCSLDILNTKSSGGCICWNYAPSVCNVSPHFLLKRLLIYWKFLFQCSQFLYLFSDSECCLYCKKSFV